MSDSILFAAQATAASGIFALVLLCLRRWRHRGSSGGAGPARIPLTMGICAPLGSALEPLVGCAMSSDRRLRTSRQLESLDLSGAVQPERWHALCLAQSVVLGAVAMIAGSPLWLGLLLAAAGWTHGGIWLKRQREAQHQAVARELPAWLDLMTVCVEAGATLTAGLRLIVAQAPQGTLRDFFERVLREIRGGRGRANAFTHVAEIYGIESLSALASTLAHAEASGMSLGQVLRAQAGQRSAERFARAEKLAMQAPVKMLGPLILCIFPCTFIVIGVPIAVRLKEALGA
jgi:tight adherence protein C